MDAGLRVFAYELLYRRPGAKEAGLNGSTEDQASSRIALAAFVDGGADDVVGDKLAFVNVSKRFVVSGAVRVLPADRVVLELPGRGDASKLLHTLRKGRDLGYQMAIDGVVSGPKLPEIVEAANYIKIDLQKHDPGELAQIVDVASKVDIHRIAIKVETPQEFEDCKGQGFDGYQGQFLCHPHVIESRELPRSRPGLLRQLASAWDPDMGLPELEQFVRQDPLLTYRLLKIVNSAFYTTGRELSSIRQALMRLGLDATRRWITLLSMAELDGRPHELLVVAMIRSRLCENLAKVRGRQDSDRFALAGLLSVLDAILGRPLPELLADLPIADELRAAVLERGGEIGAVLRCAIGQERGQWSEAHSDALSAEVVQENYLEALRWTQEVGGVVAA